MRADDVIKKLGLQPLPQEGGFYRETYRGTFEIPMSVLPATYTTPRPAGTAIYYMITPETCSALHRLQGDELWHFYLGNAVEQIQLLPDGRSRILRLGSDLEGGCVPQALVPGGAWQSTRLLAGGTFALMGTTMAPGFDFVEYEHGDPADLAKRYADLKTWLAGGSPNPEVEG